MATQSQVRQFILAPEQRPESIPTLDELPEADISDLVKAFQYQCTIDAEFVL